MSERLTAEHLERIAYVYVRQSTLHQVQQHPESRRRQQALAGRARELGFREVIVIDEDLGRSGGGSVERPGFARLLEAVCSGAVGAVLALEASRLARNNRDWHHLIDLCALASTLVIDHDGVYDPRRLNDRLLLGLKGTMSEFELGLLRQRAQEALQAMVRRGAVLTELPIGYERTADNRCEMTPDRQVQEAIRGVFAKFRELGSARQVLLWYRQERIPLPTRSEAGEIVWRLPGYPRVLSILKNPTYAGAFVYGRTRTETAVVDGRARKRAGRSVPRDAWSVVLRDHHAGYIRWAEYEEHLRMLEANAAMRGLMRPGAAKSGGALLAGLLRCGRCGRKLHVAYSGATGRVPRYHCKGAQINHGTAWCISFGGLRVDEAVVAEVLRAVAPLGIEAALAAAERHKHEEDQAVRALRLACEKARYEAARAQRQYDAVDPENRLVAAELEVRWNQALAEVAALERRITAAGAAHPALSESERQRLLELGADLEALWHHAAASPALKKRVLRSVLEEIVADVCENPPRTELRLHWKGGVHTRLLVRRNARGQHGRATDREVVDQVRALAKVCQDFEIARLLNRLGYRTGAGNGWTEARVRTLRSYQEIPACRPRAERVWCTLDEAAHVLGVSATSVRRLIREGLLEGEQVVTHAPWVIPRPSLDAPAVQAAARAIREGRRAPRTVPSRNEIPLFSTT